MDHVFRQIEEQRGNFRNRLFLSAIIVITVGYILDFYVALEYGQPLYSSLSNIFAEHGNKWLRILKPITKIEHIFGKILGILPLAGLWVFMMTIKAAKKESATVAQVFLWVHWGYVCLKTAIIVIASFTFAVRLGELTQENQLAHQVLFWVIVAPVAATSVQFLFTFKGYRYFADYKDMLSSDSNIGEPSGVLAVLLICCGTASIWIPGIMIFLGAPALNALFYIWIGSAVIGTGMTMLGCYLISAREN